MKHCPITYEKINDDARYSERGLKLISPQLKQLQPLKFSADEQRAEAIARAGRMSIQGVQLKLSARLHVKEGQLELVDHHGRFILKPQSEYYPELPENEAITMTLAARVGIEVPLHGLVYSKDNTMTYFIKRFDRVGHSKKVSVEDFAQILQFTRDTKYSSSMEQVAKVILEYCSFPKVEAMQFFKRTLFNFLTGNEDMHLKNFSLIRRDKKIVLSPAYDLLNTSIAQQNTKEEIALPLNGKKRNLTKNDLLDYFAQQRLQLNATILGGIMQEISQAFPEWERLIKCSFLSDTMKKKYLKLLEERGQCLAVI